MANWLNQLQSLLGQSSSSTSSSADQGLGKLLVPGALGGLAGQFDIHYRRTIDQIQTAELQNHAVFMANNLFQLYQRHAN